MKEKLAEIRALVEGITETASFGVGLSEFERLALSPTQIIQRVEDVSKRLSELEASLDTSSNGVIHPKRVCPEDATYEA